MLKSLEKAILPRQRLSDQIRDELKRMILRGDLKRGVKLPTEEQLAGQLKVSKVSVREALRNLETEGLIEKRRGVHGGSFVAHPGSEKMGEWVVNYFRVGMITPEELVDFRKTLEPALVALAVERRTDKDLRAIKADHRRNRSRGTTRQGKHPQGCRISPLDRRRLPQPFDQHGDGSLGQGV